MALVSKGRRWDAPVQGCGDDGPGCGTGLVAQRQPHGPARLWGNRGASETEKTKLFFKKPPKNAFIRETSTF